MTSKIASRPATPASPDDPRTAILAAAARLFVGEGFATASMDAVRRAAGVSNGSLYHFFPTKLALACDLYVEALRSFHGALVDRVTAGPGAEAGVRGLVDAYCSWVAGHPDLARVLHELRRVEAIENSPDVEAANEHAFGVLRAWVDEHAKAGAMRRVPFSVWMALVFAPLIAMTRDWVVRDQPRVPLRERKALADAIWAAVANDS